MANAQNIWFGQRKSDPKRRFRFILNMNYLDKQNRSTKLPVYYVKTATKPKATVSTVEHSFLSYNFKYPGRVTWDNITVTLVDPVSPNMSAVFMEMLIKSGYQYPNDSNKRTGISKLSATNVTGDVSIDIIDGDNNVVETWTLKNAYIASVDFGGNLDYTSDELSEISVEFAYDWAECAGTTGAQPLSRRAPR